MKPSETIKPVPEILSTCDCNSCASTCEKIQKDGDDQRQVNFIVVFLETFLPLQNSSPLIMQSAIDFEDEIQDFVYVRNDPGDLPKESRAKRQVEFPETFEKETTKEPRKNDDTKPVMLNEEYIQYYYTINDSSITTFELTQLRHYSTYTISLKACREKMDEADVKSDMVDEACGPDYSVSIITLKKDENDLIPMFDAVNVHSNISNLGSIKVTWSAPKNPNGLILFYTIRHRRNDIEHTKWEAICITHKTTSANNSFHILESLNNGNYTIQIAATSMAGPGNFTEPKYVLIRENNNYNIWYIITTLILVFCILTVILIYFVKRYYLTSISSMKLIANVNPDYAGVHYKQDGWEVVREKVIQLQELGQGSFGMVYEGIIKDLKIDGGETRCAIKTVNENATDKERISFLNEASVMKQFDTAFVVRLLGVVSTSQPTMVSSTT